MAKLIESISRFDEGLVDDIRLPVGSGHANAKHFDIYSNPLRLTPYRSTTAESDATSVADFKLYDVRNFQLGKDGHMYGLGNNLGGFPKVFSKTDPTTGNWAKPANAEGSAALIYGAFLEWQSAFWMFSGTTNVSKWAIGSTFTNTVATLGTSIVTVAQFVIGSDDNLYGFYNNKVVRISNAGVVTDNVLTNLPSDMRITSVCRYGQYLAIGMAYGTSATSAPVGISRVFIWDMASTTTTTDTIDWGEGALMVLGNVEGRIVGVSNKYLETPWGLSSLALGFGSMVVRVYSGGEAQVYKEIIANQSVTLGRFIRDVVVKDNKMYWVASVPFNQSTSTESTYNLGIWAFGRKNVNGSFALTLDYIEEGIDTANFKINSFGNAGNCWFINHSADGSVTKTDSTVTYSFTSIYESVIFNSVKGLRNRHIPDSSVIKKLHAITVTFNPLPSGATVTLKYRKDAEASYTTISTTTTKTAGAFVLGAEYTILTVGTTDFTLIGATSNTVGVIFIAVGVGTGTGTAVESMYHSAINIESTGGQLPEYKEIQYRIESTGGAVITGLETTSDSESKKVYE